MKKLKDIKRGTYNICFTILKGKNKGFQFPFNLKNMKYDTPLNLETLTYGDDCGTNLSLNDYIARGEVKTSHYVTEVCYEPTNVSRHYADITEFKKWQAELRKMGADVSLDAIAHNYYAWSASLKSGYRGRTFFLFTPCGGNPFSLTATKLDKHFKDWQHTYVC